MGTSDFMEDMMLYGTFQHRQSDFNLGSHAYRLGAMDGVTVSSFGYGLDPEVALLSVDGEERDTLERRDYVKRGEYLHLAGHSYRFDSITPDGGEVFLVRDDQFAEREGTQVGMLAPEFEMVTTEGDTVNSTELHDKPIVVANSCGCGGDTLSPRAFSEIREAFADRLHTIRLDSKISDPPAGWNVDETRPTTRTSTGTTAACTAPASPTWWAKTGAYWTNSRSRTGKAACRSGWVGSRGKRHTKSLVPPKSKIIRTANR